MADIFSLNGKVALITGGSRGIGLMIAREYVKRGAKVYISARKENQVNDAVKLLNTLVSGSAFGFACDVSNVAGIDQLVEYLKSKEKKLDILVNNAGAAWGMPYSTFSESGWDKVMNLNVRSVFFLTQRLTPLLRVAALSSNSFASVINIASVNGVDSNSLMQETYSYSASKAAVIHMTRVLAKRLVAYKIHVNAISPGAFPSEMNKLARDEPDAISSGIPAGRVGFDEEMAGPAVFLASKAGGYCVGANILVDGGLGYCSGPPLPPLPELPSNL